MNDLVAFTVKELGRINLSDSREWKPDYQYREFVQTLPGLRVVLRWDRLRQGTGFVPAPGREWRHWTTSYFIADGDLSRVPREVVDLVQKERVEAVKGLLQTLEVAFQKQAGGRPPEDFVMIVLAGWWLTETVSPCASRPNFGPQEVSLNAIQCSYADDGRPGTAVHLDCSLAWDLAANHQPEADEATVVVG